MTQDKDARIAALEAQLAERVRVKPLEWRKGRAETPFGPYHVIEEANDDEPFWFVMFNGKAAAMCGTHGDEESAIFAAQADYERRIRSALEATPPAPKVTEDMVERVARAICRAHGKWIEEESWHTYRDQAVAAITAAQEQPVPRVTEAMVDAALAEVRKHPRTKDQMAKLRSSVRRQIEAALTTAQEAGKP